MLNNVSLHTPAFKNSVNIGTEKSPHYVSYRQYNDITPHTSDGKKGSIVTVNGKGTFAPYSPELLANAFARAERNHKPVDNVSHVAD
jgi:hypothetical protein